MLRVSTWGSRTGGRFSIENEGSKHFNRTVPSLI
jgi:hypothetical protein